MSGEIACWPLPPSGCDAAVEHRVRQHISNGRAFLSGWRNNSEWKSERADPKHDVRETPPQQKTGPPPPFSQKTVEHRRMNTRASRNPDTQSRHECDNALLPKKPTPPDYNILTVANKQESDRIRKLRPRPTPRSRSDSGRGLVRAKGHHSSRLICRHGGAEQQLPDRTTAGIRGTEEP